MIKFPCKCGHLFNLTEDMAGGLAQCPRCGLLADVPTLGDLANITEDGIFKIGEALPFTDEIGVAELHEAFTPKTVDYFGREKDLRPDEEHYRMIGIPAEVDAVGFSPKYDPVTGELIRTLEVKEIETAPLGVITVSDEEADVAPMQVIPVETVGAIPSIGYAADATRKNVTPLTILLELFMPGNVIVLLFLFVVYFVAEKVAGLLQVGETVFPLMPILNIPLWLIFAHYGCVIEDLGPDACDELPRPLRHLASQEDLFKPFLCVTSALVICYLPAVLVNMQSQRIGHFAFPVMLTLELVGSFFLPAVLLTTVTGATYANLRPDRVFGVISRCGGDYVLLVGVLLLGLLPSAFYFSAGAILAPDVKDKIMVKAAQPYVMLPLTAIAVYMTHFFCWYLGLMYRAHHDEFPWLLQRHIPKRRDPVIAPPRRSRYRSRPH